MSNELPGRKIWIAGHRGLLGGALQRRLGQGDHRLVTIGRDELDLRDQSGVNAFVASEKPDAIILAAARVGGIAAHKAEPSAFILDNLLIAGHVLQAALDHGVGTLVHIASSAVYPADVPQPMSEDALMTGRLDPTHEPYGLAKLAGMTAVKAIREQYGRSFFSVLPCNLYGPGASFHPEKSHFIPALIRRAHEAKMAGAQRLVAWGTGTPRREVLFIDDCADAIAFLLENPPASSFVNLGSGEDRSLREVIEIICEIVGFTGEIAFDATKPDGVARRLMDCGRLNQMGWRPRMPLREGIRATYAWFLENHETRSAA